MYTCVLIHTLRGQRKTLVSSIALPFIPLKQNLEFSVLQQGWQPENADILLSPSPPKVGLQAQVSMPGLFQGLGLQAQALLLAQPHSYPEFLPRPRSLVRCSCLLLLNNAS